jgi:hypothetical protein
MNIMGSYSNVKHQELKRSNYIPHHHQQGNSEIQKVRTIFCSEINCELIEEFKVADNNTLDCYEKYLGIEFTIPIMNVHKNDTENLPVYAYLSDEATIQSFNVLSDTQEYSNTCSRIKK